jgi:Fe-S-cluster containining protein
LTSFVCNHAGDCDANRACCVETEMTLTESDMERIDSLGHMRNEYVVRTKDGFCQLRNLGGYCCFYDSEEKTCRIYEQRPDGCRFYPIIYDVRRHRCVVDKDCPSRETVTKEEINRVCPEVRNLVKRLMAEAKKREDSR